ncbi:kinase-like domain-containing protein [Triangularia verruculosa]|uniref:non-specific serine/threonine protein kinase n=1 Tax=Triangularia verruculosa TaxID=2587418 RepID=A0AAN6XQK5_9PEZI|nr:kinase-like domain-containing protein [Triangularia verruculosa]
MAHQHATVGASAYQVLALGLFQSELASSQVDEANLRLCDVAIRIFAARPERRFLHAFRLSKSVMEMWTFDRAGAYSSNAFDILQEPHRFKNIIAEYMLMDDSGLGLNTAIQQDDEGAYLKLEGSDQPWGTRLCVSEGAFVKQDYLVGPGTTCFKAHIPGSSKRELVVKFTWEEGEVSAEPRFLALANERGVWGLPKLEGYQFLGDIANLRQGLQFDQPYKFSPARRSTGSMGESDQPQLPESTSDSHAPPSANQAPNSVSEPATGTDKFCNLRFECVVTSPLGRPLDTFSSPSELLAVFRDVVRALRSLYLQAKIIHRDISPQNIIIAPHNTLNPDAPVGMLIDLDFALDLANPPSERKMVGSRGFMAIGILGGDDHTYRHDLESLFYVFLWLAICHDGATSRHVPDTSRLHAWRGADFLAVFYQKRQDMQPEEFSRWIESEFTQPFRPYLPLATALHQLLFPMRNGKMFIGTDEGSDSMERLYAGMVAAFESYVA